jgi:hypothetical protein
MRLVRIAALLALAAVCVAAAAHVRPSAATYTTSSQTDVTASTDSATSWLHLYSQSTDPGYLTGYDLSRLINGADGPLAATGIDTSLVADMGDFPDKNRTYSFSRVFTVMTPATFPDPAVTSIRIDVSLLDDPATGEQPISTPRLSALNGSGATTSMTIGPGQQRQVNLQVGVHKRFTLGMTYYPEFVLTVTMIGGSYPAGYYQYSVPVAVTDSGGN